jgi:signal transduction histidine kinase
MTFSQKQITLAVAPLVIVTIAVTMFLTWQSTRLAKSNIEACGHRWANNPREADQFKSA